MNRYERRMKQIVGLVMLSFALTSAVPVSAFPTQEQVKRNHQAPVASRDGGIVNEFALDGGVKLNQFASVQEGLLQLIDKVAKGGTVDPGSSELATR